MRLPPTGSVWTRSQSGWVGFWGMKVWELPEVWDPSPALRGDIREVQQSGCCRVTRSGLHALEAHPGLGGDADPRHIHVAV